MEGGTMTWILLAVLGIAAFPVWVEFRRDPMDAKARKNAPGAFARLSNGLVHYQWLGAKDGPVAVCVHGLTTPSFVYRSLAAGLGKAGYRVLVYDHFGRGFSDRPSMPQDAAFFIKNLEELMENQGVEDDITLIGYSMGGAVVAAFAAKHAARLRRLVMIAPAGMGHDLGRMMKFMQETPLLGRWLMHAVYPASHRKGCEAERGLDVSVPGIIDLQIKELQYRGFIDAVLASMKGLISSDMEAIHRAIAASGLPVLAIWGADDAVIPVAAVNVLKGRNPAAVQVVIDGAGHGLTYTHTDEVVAAILDA